MDYAERLHRGGNGCYNKVNGSFCCDEAKGYV